VDNPQRVDAGTTATPAPANLFAPCLTCVNTGQRQGAQLFAHTMHKIANPLWTTGLFALR